MKRFISYEQFAFLGSFPMGISLFWGHFLWSPAVGTRLSGFPLERTPGQVACAGVPPTYRKQTYRRHTYRQHTYRQQTYGQQTYRQHTYRQHTYRQHTYRQQTTIGGTRLCAAGVTCATHRERTHRARECARPRFWGAALEMRPWPLATRWGYA